MAKKRTAKQHEQDVRDALVAYYNKKTNDPAQQIVPYGTYDPALDQQKRAADRGLGYLLDDTGKQGQRATVDYGLGVNQINQDAGRSLSDLMQSRSRGAEDHQAQLNQLSQSYQRLGNTQRQQQAAAGVMGGAAVQAAQKRAANQAADTVPIETNYNRFTADSATAEQRLNENKQSALGSLLTDYTRGNTDRTDATTRAQGENVFYGQDINELKVDQAKQANLLPVGGSQHPNAPTPKPKGYRARTLPGLKYKSYGKYGKPVN